MNPRFYSIYSLPFLVLVAVSMYGCGDQATTTKTTTSNNASTAAGSPPTLIPGCASGQNPAAAYVFNENPLTSSGAALAFTASLNSVPTYRYDLLGLDGTCLLQSDRYTTILINSDGTYPKNPDGSYKSADTLYPSYVKLDPTNNSLNYTPSQVEFQQVNSFYYASALKALLTSLGADLSSMGKVTIDAHCNVSNNAYYSPGSKKLCFGYSTQAGGKKVWGADDGDVVVHETGHTINHTLSSTSIMNSTGEAGAIDESVADYWALTIMNDPQLSEWYLGAINSSLVRDATQSTIYPDSMVYEIHDDSRVLTQILWDLRKPANLGTATTDALVKRALQLLPATTRYKDFYKAIYDASGPAFLNLNAAQRGLILTKFTAKGFHRADTAAGLRLSTAGGTVKQIYVIDDHEISAQSGGNCNGALDVGETALVLVNLENPNAGKMGMGVATLGAAPSGISIPSGGQIGEYFKFNGNSDFVSSMPPPGSNRDDATIMAAFLISATGSGVKNFSLSFRPMYSDPTSALAINSNVTVNFSLTVGGVATKTSCTNGALWP